MNTLHALVLAFILWGIVIAAVVGALRHLMKRPHLTSEQKLVALLVSSVITVPVSGLLYFPIAWTFVHLGGAGEDVGELSVNCGWGFSAVGFQPRQCYFSRPATARSAPIPPRI